jgi:hypothetical protein
MYSLYLQKTNINKIMIIRWFYKNNALGPSTTAADDDDDGAFIGTLHDNS